MKQGHKITARMPNQTIVYQGKIISPPRVLPDGTSIISAYGARSVAERYTQRIIYQLADATEWSGVHEAPFNYAQTNPSRYRLSSKKDSLRFDVGMASGGQAYVVGDSDGYAIYTGDQFITRVKWTYRTEGGNANFDIRLLGAKDFGAGSVVQTDTTNLADTSTRDVDMTGANYNIAMFQIRCNTNVSPALYRFYIRDIRVMCNGATDTLTTSGVATDLISRLNYATGKITGSVNIQPLDWQNAASDLLDYIGDIEDQYWFIDADPSGAQFGRLNFRNWGRKSWNVRLDEDALNHENLRIAPLYDSITTGWDSPGQVPRHLRSRATDVGLTDPLPGLQSDYPDRLQLADPQRTNALATTVNTRALRYLTTLRLQGQFTILKLPRGVHPFSIQPGDVITLNGFDPICPPQRIVACSYHSDGTVDVSLGFDNSLAGIIERVALRRHRPWLKRHGFAKVGR